MKLVMHVLLWLAGLFIFLLLSEIIGLLCRGFQLAVSVINMYYSVARLHHSKLLYTVLKMSFQNKQLK